MKRIFLLTEDENERLVEMLHIVQYRGDQLPPSFYKDEIMYAANKISEILEGEETEDE